LLVAQPKQVPAHNPDPLPKTNQDRIVRAKKLMSSDPSERNDYPFRRLFRRFSLAYGKQVVVRGREGKVSCQAFQARRLRHAMKQRFPRLGGVSEEVWDAIPIQVSPQTQHKPALYRWPLPQELKEEGCTLRITDHFQHPGLESKQGGGRCW